MRYNELISILKESMEIEPKAEKESGSIMEIKLLNKELQHWNEHTLYLGSMDNTQAQPCKPIMLISPDKNLNLPEGSLYSLVRHEDLFKVYNMAEELILEDLRADGLFVELAQMALSGIKISSLINNAATLMGNALILTDSAQKVLAHSTNFEIMDPSWAANIERGYCSNEFIQKVRANKYMKEWSKQGSDIQLITLPGDLQPKLVARFTQEGHIAGAVVMIGHHTPIGRSHRRQLSLVGKVLFDAFHRDTARADVSQSVHSSILYDLLDEKEASDILEHMAEINVDFPKGMRVIVARFARQIQNRFIKNTFRVELEHIFPKGHSVQYKSYIGILVSVISDKQEEALIRLAKNEDVSIGVSWSFSVISEFKRHFNQAVSSIKQAERFGQTNQVFEYSNFSCYDLFYNYIGKTPLKNYCHPALLILRQYDLKNNTEFYLTLRTYLEHANNLKTTSEEMFIHRNTLLYRLGRIIQLTELNLKNPALAHSLMYSFKIELFLEEF